MAWAPAFADLFGAVQVSALALVAILAVAVGDGILIGLDLAFRYATLDGTELPNWFNLSQERGLGEVFEHLVIGAGALGLMVARHRIGKMMPVAAVLILVGLDNALELHERSGRLLAEGLVDDSSLLAAQLGEIAFLILLALAIFGTAIYYLRARVSRSGAGATLILASLAGAGFFGLVVDALHALMSAGTAIEVALGGIEDGGELIFLTMAGVGAVVMTLIAPASPGQGREDEAS